MPVSFLVIGAMKAGTTTLRTHLSGHPEISMPRRSEPAFFVREQGWSRGPDWYRGLFDRRRPVRGEISTAYTKRHLFAGVSQRIREVVPEVRLVYLLRDPLGRLVSHYRHNVAHGREERSFAQAMADLEDNAYLATSLYHYQLEPYLERFPRESLLLLTTESLAADPTRTLRRLYEFVGASPDHTPPELGLVRHSGKDKRRPSRITRRLGTSRFARGLRAVVGRWVEQPVERPEIDSALRDRLLDRIDPDLEALRRATGRSFADWPSGALR